MKSVKIVLFFIIIYISPSLYGQKTKRVTCSNVINETWYFWKKDSLTKNGYRKAVYRKFLDCQIDSVHMNYLVSKLGKPTLVRTYKNEKFFDLLYDYYDYKKMDKDFRGPYGYDYLFFSVGKNDSLITDIDWGSGDY